MLRNLIYQKHFSAKVDNIFFVPEPEAFSPKSYETAASPAYMISVVQTADGSNVLLCKSQPFTKSFSLISVSNFANRDGSRKDQFPAGCLESAGLLSSLQWMSFPAGCCIAEFYLNQRKVTIQIPNVWNDLNYQRPQQWIVGTRHLVEKFLE